MLRFQVLGCGYLCGLLLKVPQGSKNRHDISEMQSSTNSVLLRPLEIRFYEHLL
jgi:hypothetical protein